jgi:hypothetical protein
LIVDAAEEDWKEGYLKQIGWLPRQTLVSGWPAAGYGCLCSPPRCRCRWAPYAYKGTKILFLNSLLLIILLRWFFYNTPKSFMLRETWILGLSLQRRRDERARSNMREDDNTKIVRAMYSKELCNGRWCFGRQAAASRDIQRLPMRPCCTGDIIYNVLLVFTSTCYLFPDIYSCVLWYLVMKIGYSKSAGHTCSLYLVCVVADNIRLSIFYSLLILSSHPLSFYGFIFSQVCV